MNWLQKTASLLVIVNMVFAPMTLRAQPLRLTNQAKIDSLTQNLDPNKYKVVFDSSGKGAFVFEKDKSQPVAFYPFRSDEELRQFSPKNLGDKMKAEMLKVGAASGTAWSHSLRNLPAESGIFAMAMGAVVATQLFSNYSQNPIAMQQHLEQQISPVGIASFYTFMYSQGVTSNILSMYLTNPAYQHMIPYLGMAVGSFMQSYLSQVLSDPDVWACGKVMMQTPVDKKSLDAGVDADPCQKAYEYLVLNKNIWKLAPGIISMLTSSALAGAFETTAKGVLESTASKVIPHIGGFDIATLLFPGGLEVKGLRLMLVKGMQIYLFVSIDNFINNKINFIWKSTWDGAELLQLNDRLVEDIFQQKKSNWSANNSTILSDVNLLHKKGSDWRMMNLSDVYEAHQNWSENLSQLTGMFNASYSFYNAFINEARNSQKNIKGLLNVSYPLNGVIAKDLAENKQDLYFSNPGFVQSMQVDTVTDVVASIDNNYQNGLYQAWAPLEEKAFRQIRNLLADQDVMKKGQGLFQLNLQMEQSIKYSGTPSYYRELERIYVLLGNPKPLLEPGRGFLATYEAAPSTANSLNGVSHQHMNGLYKTDKLTDFLLMQMICGPDAEKKEALIRQSNGFPSIFSAPQIKMPEDNFNTYCFMSGEFSPSEIYTTRVKAAASAYDGFLDYLKVNIRPTVLGAEKSNFQEWWKQTTESQMQTAFEDYQKSYGEIVAKMMVRIFHSPTKQIKDQTLADKTWSSVSSLFTTEDSAFNIGPMSNTATVSIFQEARTYQVVLGELLKDVYKTQKGSALPTQYFAEQMEPAVQYSPEEVNGPKNLNLEKAIPMISLLGRGDTLEFDRLVQPFILNPNVASMTAPTGHRLMLQDELEKEFTNLSDLLKQIKVVSITDEAAPSSGLLSYFQSNKKTHIGIQSTLENDQLEDQLLKIQSVLTRFKQALGVNKSEGPQDLAQNNNSVLNDSKLKISTLLELINSGAQTKKSQSQEVWTAKISAVQAVLADILNSNFKSSSQTKIAQDAINGLNILLSQKTRQKNFVAQWQNQLLAVKTSLNALLLDIDKSLASTTNLVELAPAQKKLALSCIENIQALALEMKMYGTIANAVDWQKLNNLKRLNAKQGSYENEIQKKLGQLRAGRLIRQ